MRHLALELWLVREWRRSAAAWLLGLAVVLLGPVCLLALPWGIVGDGYLSTSYMRSIWYLSTYVGATVGLLLLARAETVWSEVGRFRQVWLAVVALSACALVHGFVALGTFQALGWVRGTAWSAALLCAGHWSALGAFVQRMPMKLGAKWLVLSSLGWWIPAFLGGVPGWDRVHWLLGPDRHLEVASLPTETSLGVLVDTIPIVAWWVAAALLPTRSAFRR